MNTVTLEGTQELMKAREVAVILATGGMGLVRAAYSAGKPAYGVRPGNAPCYIERSAELPKAARDIMIGKTFDNGLLCSSPNSVVVDEPIAEDARRQFQALGAYFLKDAEADALAKVLVTAQRLPNPALVGRPASVVAEKAGLKVPDGTKVLIAPLRSRPRLSVVDRETVPGAVVVNRQRLAAGVVNAASRSCATAEGHDGHPFRKPGCDSPIRVAQARVPDLCQHADHSRIHRPDNGTRSGDDARVRRVGRQHHLGQHLAASSPEHQAAGVECGPRHRQRQWPRGQAPSSGHPQRNTLRSRARFRRRRQSRSSAASSSATGGADRRVSRLERLQGAAVRRRGRCGACLEWFAPAGETAVEFVCEEDVRAALSAGRKRHRRETIVTLQPATSANREVFVQASWPN